MLPVSEAYVQYRKMPINPITEEKVIESFATEINDDRQDFIMLEWLTFIIGLITSVVFAEYLLHNRPLRLMKIIFSVAAGTIGYFVLLLFWKSGAFLSAFAIGHITGLIFDYICGERQSVLSEICLYISGDMIWLPICLCGKSIWDYAVYLSALIFCLSMLPLCTSTQRDIIHKHTAFYPNRSKYNLIISVVPCTVILPEILVLISIRSFSVLQSVFTFVSFLAIWLLAVYLQTEISRRLNAEYLNDAMTRWQRESRDYMNTIRSQRHDFNLHLHAVSRLINSGKYDECQQYIKKLVNEAAAINDIMPVCDPVVGSMLYNMREEARRSGSEIYYDITYDMEDILCNGFECNKIIGNLLQNAIDALQSDEDKEYGIHLKIFKRRGNTVIISENRFVGEPSRIAGVFEPGYSTKKGHEGIGLSMIKRTVGLYGGRIYPEFRDDKIRFVVNIPNKVRFSTKGEAI